MNASLNEKLGTVKWGEFKLGDLFEVVSYKRSKISRIPWLFEPKCRNNAELTYILLPCIAIYSP